MRMAGDPSLTPQQAISHHWLGPSNLGVTTTTQDMARSKSAKMIGELVVSAGLLKSSSLGRIGKVSVKGMSGPLQPAPFGTK